MKESRERVRSACGIQVFISCSESCGNLAPAHYRKDGALFDLAIAIGILAHLGVVSKHKISRYLFAGELSLSGALKPINGVLSLAELARQENLGFVLPAENGPEASIMGLGSIVPVSSLNHLIEVLNHGKTSKNCRSRVSLRRLCHTQVRPLKDNTKPNVL